MSRHARMHVRGLLPPCTPPSTSYHFPPPHPATSRAAASGATICATRTVGSCTPRRKHARLARVVPEGELGGVLRVRGQAAGYRARQRGGGRPQRDLQLERVRVEDADGPVREGGNDRLAVAGVGGADDGGAIRWDEPLLR